MQPQEAYKRYSRFKRVFDKRTLFIQPRDTEILMALTWYRFLNSRQIIALTGGGEQGTLRRLNRLFHAGLLDRPLAQIKKRTIGSEPMVYALGKKGVDWLREEEGIWCRKQRHEVNDVYLEHTLIVANFMVNIERACRAVSKVELIRQNDILHHIKTNDLRSKKRDKINPLCGRLKTELNFKGKRQEIRLSVLPDQIFGLYFPDEPSRKNKLFFALEADRSTMPIMRSNFNNTSYFKKMLGYWEGYRQNIFQELYGIRSLRVLTITKTHKRISNMIQAGKLIDQRKKGSRMFLFATINEFNLDFPLHIFEKVWRNGRDKRLTSIIE